MAASAAGEARVEDKAEKDKEEKEKDEADGAKKDKEEKTDQPSATCPPAELPKAGATAGNEKSEASAPCGAAQPEKDGTGRAPPFPSTWLAKDGDAATRTGSEAVDEKKNTRCTSSAAWVTSGYDILQLARADYAPKFTSTAENDQCFRAMYDECVDGPIDEATSCDTLTSHIDFKPWNLKGSFLIRMSGGA